MMISGTFGARTFSCVAKKPDHVSSSHRCQRNRSMTRSSCDGNAARSGYRRSIEVDSLIGRLRMQIESPYFPQAQEPFRDGSGFPLMLFGTQNPCRRMHRRKSSESPEKAFQANAERLLCLLPWLF